MFSDRREAGEVGVAVVVEQDTGRANVAVDDLAPVGVAERGTHLLDDPQRDRWLQWAVGERVLERATAQQRHHEVPAGRIAPVVVQADDVRVVEVREQSAIGLEAADEVGLVGDVAWDDPDRDLTAHRRLVGAVDRRSGTATEQRPDLVAPHRSRLPIRRPCRRCVRPLRW